MKALYCFVFATFFASSAFASDVNIQGCTTPRQISNAKNVILFYDKLSNWDLAAIQKLFAPDFVFSEACLQDSSFCPPDGIIALRGVKEWLPFFQAAQTGFTACQNGKYPDAFYKLEAKEATCIGEDTVLVNGTISGLARGMTTAFHSPSHQVWRINHSVSGSEGSLHSVYAFFDDNAVSTATYSVLNPPSCD